MARQTIKNNWTSNDPVGATDLNNIGDNLLYILDENTVFTGLKTIDSVSIGNWSQGASYARFGHKDYNSSSNYGILQQNNGNVYLDSTAMFVNPSGASTRFGGILNFFSDTTNSFDPVVNVNRNIDSVGANAHCFSDSSSLQLQTAGKAYNSYDCRITVDSAVNYDHYAAFQSGPDFSGYTGTMTHLYHLVTTITGMNAGTNITNEYGLYKSGRVAGGSVQNSYGCFLKSGGAVNNFGIWDENNVSYFGQFTGAGESFLQIGTQNEDSSKSSKLRLAGKSAGAIQLYMDYETTTGGVHSISSQAVADIMQFNMLNGNIIFNNNIFPTTTPTEETITITTDGNTFLPRGIFYITRFEIEMSVYGGDSVQASIRQTDQDEGNITVSGIRGSSVIAYSGTQLAVGTHTDAATFLVFSTGSNFYVNLSTGSSTGEARVKVTRY